MPQRTFQRVLIVSALLCTLTLALPPRAHAAPLAGADGLWGWLTRLVESRISVLLWEDALSPEQTSPIVKEGPGVDPDGRPRGTGTACAAGSTCTTSDSGVGPDR